MNTMHLFIYSSYSRAKIVRQLKQLVSLHLFVYSSYSRAKNVRQLKSVGFFFQWEGRGLFEWEFS